MSVESSENRSKRGKPLPTNLLLAAVLFLICGFAYWLEINKKREGAQELDAKPRLFTLDAGQEVESLHIVDKLKGLDIALSCKDRCKLSDPSGDWRITAPIAFKGDSSNVGTFISGLAAANVQETVPVEDPANPEATYKKFGLEKDQRLGRLAAFKLKKDAEPYTVYVGDNAAVGENLYILVTGPGLKDGSVKIVPNYLRENLQRNLSYWRSKKLFDFSASEIEGFKLKNALGTVEVVRDGLNWSLLPGKLMADNEAADTYVTGMAFLNAHEYLSDDKKKDAAKLGIDRKKPHFEAWLRVAKRGEIKLDVYDFVYEKQPRLYAEFSDRDTIVSLDRAAVEKFKKTAADFRFHKLLTAAEKEQTSTVELKLAGQPPVTFAKVEAGWKLTGGKLEGFEPTTVDSALVKLGSAKVLEFQGKRPAPAGVPELSTWTLLDKNGGKLRTIVIYGSAQRQEYYSKLTTGELAKLDRLSASTIPAKAEDFMKPKISSPEAKH